ncbi:BufA2 family periplasmic bufferin-type metallophore [Sphingomonas sp. GB1N7]|uniref:BufA2 family periplasmic bufferin-type metallophore n=1 Tax=Parasphingomonas caseinilytica TaxID=3096158 RepID=UPI002FC7430E
MNTRILGASFAATAAIIAVAGVTTATPAVAKGAKLVHCYGINSCKGTSDCKTAANECKGQNECKGHGFKAVSSKACAKAGGSLTEAK